MTKASPRKSKSMNRKSRKSLKAFSGHKASRPHSGPEPDVVRLTSEAKELYSKSGETQRKADELHKSIEKMHGKISSSRARVENSPAADAKEHFDKEDEAVTESKRPGKPFPIVGIGASAGGFEAFNEFLKVLPPDTGMGFVLVQHLDPKHKSQLTELLRRNA